MKASLTEKIFFALLLQNLEVKQQFCLLAEDIYLMNTVKKSQDSKQHSRVLN